MTKGGSGRSWGMLNSRQNTALLASVKPLLVFCRGRFKSLKAGKRKQEMGPGPIFTRLEFTFFHIYIAIFI